MEAAVGALHELCRGSCGNGGTGGTSEAEATNPMAAVVSGALAPLRPAIPVLISILHHNDHDPTTALALMALSSIATATAEGEPVAGAGADADADAGSDPMETAEPPATPSSSAAAAAASAAAPAAASTGSNSTTTATVGTDAVVAGGVCEPLMGLLFEDEAYGAEDMESMQGTVESDSDDEEPPLPSLSSIQLMPPAFATAPGSASAAAVAVGAAGGAAADTEPSEGPSQDAEKTLVVLHCISTIMLHGSAKQGETMLKLGLVR